ncbi:MAG: Fur family transcriptional regulator [Geminicoccaceae bacterium]
MARREVQENPSAGRPRGLRSAERHCAEHGLSLTPLRRRVLEIVFEAGRPVGAYDIIAELARERGKTAPPTVYRALDFLASARLIHKVHSLNAWLACSLDHGECDSERRHTAELLICRACGSARELVDDTLRRKIQETARSVGFLADGIVLEVQGLCRDCGHDG